jgi:hypothetical protein
MSDALITEGVALVDLVEQEGATLRLLGGAAVALHSSGVAYREIGDLDAVTTRSGVATVTSVVVARGYAPEARFNALHGDKRLIFVSPVAKLDVFVDTFEMCHQIELASRLGLDSPTIPLTDLMVTKLQVVELNAKDARDLAELISHHELGEGPGDHVDAIYLADLVRDDWGLWRTLAGTLERLGELEPSVVERARELLRVIDEAPKGRKFRLRAKVGDRKRWYELPEEVG